MVIDYNKVDDSRRRQTRTLPQGTLYVLEQIPGQDNVVYRDCTDMLLEHGYWASYNRPYFADINEKSMYARIASQHGELFTYQKCPRARIFAREQGKVLFSLQFCALLHHLLWIRLNRCCVLCR